MTANSLSDSAASNGASFPRIKSGNIQADEILGGGFPSHSINILMGPPGTGKTIFAERLMLLAA
jgi:circadian clock protein KaiC